jgi:ABC-type transport system involved in multi-copper enzyme maturation permease subunit
MWYKEWLAARYALYLLLAGLVIPTIFICAWMITRDNWQSIFGAWIIPGSGMAVVMAALIGTMILAQEQKEGTLQFLLSRPISPEKIYSAKLLLNSLFISGIFGVIGIAVIAVDAVRYFFLDTNALWASTTLGLYGANTPAELALKATVDSLIRLGAVCLTLIVVVWTMSIIGVELKNLRSVIVAGGTFILLMLLVEMCVSLFVQPSYRGVIANRLMVINGPEYFVIILACGALVFLGGLWRIRRSLLS